MLAELLTPQTYNAFAFILFLAIVGGIIRKNRRK